MNKLIAGLGLTLALGACGQTWGPVPNSFLREAGAQTDTGLFGNATMHNTMIMNGELDYVVSLANRFAEEVPSTITFAFDSAQLDAAARAVLDRQADWIRQFPEVRFRVYGHTDAVGSTAYNRQLGQRRANAAVAYLSSRGISRARLEAVVSYGETQPLIVTQGRERRNRRTVTEVSGFLKRHPTVLDGKYAQVVYREYVASAVPATTLSDTNSLLSSGQ
ncbi:OmpA family protein [Antarcticimicrobium luteum]|uniref:OmpA family protein n=1 Tax=Antarcticimicrobium luteum TaxID=2547397 RepID=A0A4R5V7M3_9RHOB|nr:OmpA family protein [Antarcticimicrobium luteum]TDK48042.1 OmpA family protein [Antarcticimicrobium luteum]